MRKFLTILIALMMATGSAGLVMAQDSATPEAPDADTAVEPAESSIARDLNIPATYFTDRGAAIATLTVVDVERGWQDYDDRDAPEPGIEYVAVTFEIDVVSRGDLDVKPNDFSLIDGIGRNISRSRVRLAEESNADIFEDTITVAAGETTGFTLLFEVYEETPLGYFMWQPARDTIILVDMNDA